MTYIRFVANKLGVSPDWIPNVKDKASMCMMAYAISFFENGVEPQMEEISEGWDLL